MKVILTIGGSDSSGGAGIQQDLKTFSSLGAYGVSVITAVTAQNTRGAQNVYALPSSFVASQLESVFDDFGLDAVKTGMLANREIVKIVYKKLKNFSAGNIVVDPVMRSTSGYGLLDENAIDELKKLISIAKITTPNISEAEILSGIRIKNKSDVETAARKIGNCVITGSETAVDTLYYNKKIYEFRDKPVNSEVHGTGCAFSSALAAFLANGCEVPEAVKRAKEYVSEMIKNSEKIGEGMRLMVHKKAHEIQVVEGAVKKFVADKNSYKLAPEVGINIVLAKQGAKNISDVAGISGRIVRDGKKMVPVGSIIFGGSHHVARVALTVMKSDPEKRAAMNIRYSPEILNACKKLKLRISGFERDRQPKDTSTMEWGTKHAIESYGSVPDIIYDKGGTGKEAMIRILDNNATRVVEIALKIAGNLD